MKRLGIAVTVLILLASPVWAQNGNYSRQATVNPQASPRAWWSNSTSAWIGALGGAGVGLSGALIGILCSLGKGKQFILSFQIVMIVLGIVSIIAGLTALFVGQPYGVWYPLVMLGGIPTIVFGSLFFVVRQRFLQIELRKMRGMDA